MPSSFDLFIFFLKSLSFEFWIGRLRHDFVQGAAACLQPSALNDFAPLHCNEQWAGRHGQNWLTGRFFTWAGSGLERDQRAA